MESSKKPRLVFVSAAVLCLATIAVYARLASHDAIHFDDNVLVTQNAAVQSGISGPGIRWAFATPILGIWHPLTTLSHMLDCELFGLDMGKHHVTSLALHVASTVLLLLLLHQMTGAVWRPALVAALFALHPLNVESVAWIAERKNVLSTFFWFLTTIAYVAWVRRPSAARYGLALLLFALGLMSKPMLVTLPCTLLLLDYWPLARTESFAHRVREKIPFFALTAIGSYVTFTLQQDVVEAAVRSIPIHLRLATAAIAYLAYLRDAFWPRDLALLYPIEGFLDARLVLIAAVVLGAVTWLAVSARRTAPYLLSGWLWYLGTFVPVIGIVHVGSQTHADRYAYVPMIGVFVMLAWLSGACVARWSSARVPVTAAWLVVITLLAVATSRQVARWKDSITLFTHTLSVTRDNLVIENALGVALAEAGRADEAIVHFGEALRLKPDALAVRESLCLAYASAGQLDQAALCLREVIAAAPTSFQAHASLALVRMQQGRSDEALASFGEAVRLNPESGEARAGLGALLVSLGRVDEAFPHLRVALEKNPSFAETHTNLGLVFASRGQLDTAVEAFQASLALDPNQPRVKRLLADAYQAQGKLDAALAGYEEALAAQPSDATLVYNVGVVLARQGQSAEALRRFEECVRLQPGHALALYQLGRAAASSGQVERAIELYESALASAPDDTEILMSLAWIRATHENPALRDGPEAVRLASNASQLLGGSHVGALATLAAAFAQNGQFDEAAKTVERALNLARMNGQKDLVATLEESLRKYSAGERMYPAK